MLGFIYMADAHGTLRHTVELGTFLSLQRSLQAYVCRALDLLAWLWPMILQSLIDVGCQYFNVMKSRFNETSAIFS